MLYLFHPFTSKLFMFLNRRCVSCKQHIVRSCLSLTISTFWVGYLVYLQLCNYWYHWINIYYVDEETNAQRGLGRPCECRRLQEAGLQQLALLTTQLLHRDPQHCSLSQTGPRPGWTWCHVLPGNYMFTFIMHIFILNKLYILHLLHISYINILYLYKQIYTFIYYIVS